MAVTIPSGVILIWTGTVATIPTGWQRVTALDGLFPKGAANAADPNTTGGNATHSHSATANHSHTMQSHSHTVALSNVASFSSNQSDGAGSEGIPGQHSHNFDVAGVSGGDLSSVAATYAAVSNDPPFYSVIYITPTGATADLLDGIVVLWNIATPPTGWTFCDGTSPTPDLRNKFLKGAGTGANAGATGGSSTNIHTLTHTHVESSHSHSGTNGGQITDSGGRRAGSGSNRLPRGHSHTVNLQATTAGSISAVSLTTVETVEPAYTKLMPIQNNNGSADRPQSIIGLWTGLLADIPSGWKLCDGTNGTPDMRSQHLKCVNTSGGIATTGGSNTHTHASQNHTHTGASHTHTGDNTGEHWPLNAVGGVGGSLDLQDGGGAHTVTSVSSTIPTWDAAATAADSQNNEPQYRTVAFIQLNGTPITDERGAEITGAVAQNDERSAEITGITPAEERSAEIVGQDDITSERGAEITGILVWTPESKPTTPVWTPEQKTPNH